MSSTPKTELPLPKPTPQQQSLLQRAYNQWLVRRVDGVKA